MVSPKSDMKGDPAAETNCPKCQMRISVRQQTRPRQGSVTRWPSTHIRLRKAAYNHIYRQHAELRSREIAELLDAAIAV